MAEKTQAASKDSQTLIVDLGKKSRKQVKRLRKGKGKLTGKIEGVVAELKASGDLKADADVVIVTVERKARNPWRGMLR